MAAARLMLLGPFGLRADGRPLHVGRKHKALLACTAAVHAAGMSRARLAGLLWPDRDEDSARNSLRQGIHQLRALLGDPALLDGRDDRVALSQSHWDVDLWRFEALAKEPDVDKRLLAAALYRGALGEGLELDTGCESWLAVERERVRGVAQSLLEQLAESELPHKQCEVAISLARRLLADDAMHEGSWRALMQLLDRAGLRAKALEAWEDCHRVLRCELGVSPCAATRAVFEALRSGEHDGHNPNPSPQTSAVPRAISGIRGVASQVQDHILCGMHFMYGGTPEDNLRARAAFDSAVAEAPGNADACVLRAWTHYLDFLYAWNGETADSWAMAREQCDDALERFPDHPSSHAFNGKLLLWARQYDAALAEYQLGLALLPTSPYMYANLADARMRVGHYDEALRLVARALELEPNDKGVFRTIEGFTRFHMGDRDAALEALRSAVTRHPLYCVAYSGIAAASAELGNLSQAREAVAKARVNNSRYSVDFALDVLPMRDVEQRERDVLPMRDVEQRERIALAWRSAGMPEHEGA
jgi:DNA-binding SARP family transcriptional activator/Tfp pilus assembly protein PilF